MKNEQDKIDNLFKKRLDDPAREVDYNHEHWDALEQMLDEKEKTPRRILWLPLISGIAAMLLLVLGWWFFKPVTDKTKPVKQQVVVKPVPDKMPVDTAVKQLPVDIASNTVTKPRSKNELGDELDTGGVGTTMWRLFQKPESTVVKSKGSQQTTKATPDTTDTGALTSGIAVNTKAPADTVGGQNLKKNEATQVAATTTPQQPVTKPAVEMTLPAKKRTGALAYRPQFAIGVIASTDLNGVNSFGAQTRVGGNFGVLVHAGITKKFTITTGAIYSVKPYMTAFDNYSTPFMFTEKPVSVTADCRMIDVPINVGYQVYQRQRNKILVGTGLSSYFMLYENYKYNYSTIVAGNPSNFKVKNSKNYLLSVANLNATFERQLTPKFSLSIQPYIKVPLSPVGFGQVSLQSAGVAVGFNYNFNFFSKPK